MTKDASFDACNHPPTAQSVPPSPTSLLPTRLLNQLPFVVLLANTVRHVGGDGPQLLGALDVEHLVVEKDVGLDLLQQRALGGPGEEQSLVDLQAPAPQCLQHTGPGAGRAARRYQEGADGTVQTLVFGVEHPLQLAQRFQETLQRTLRRGKVFMRTQVQILPMAHIVLANLSKSDQEYEITKWMKNISLQ